MKFGMCLLMLMSGSVLCGFKGNYFDAPSGGFALISPSSIDDAAHRNIPDETPLKFNHDAF
jgi:hypothetical protein